MNDYFYGFPLANLPMYSQMYGGEQGNGFPYGIMMNPPQQSAWGQPLNMPAMDVGQPGAGHPFFQQHMQNMPMGNVPSRGPFTPFGNIDPYENFTPGGARSTKKQKVKNILKYGPGFNKQSQAKNPGTDPYEFGYG